MHICVPSQLGSYAADQASKTAVAEGTHARVTVWCLEPGQDIHPHVHAGDHIWVIQTGEGWFLSGDGEHPISAGMLIFAPEGEPHGMRAKTRLSFVSVSAG